ncbi:RND transporter MFP subunit [Xenorhabdus sp. GDc328]|uniref:efflux RND transporter periplasmic adaptor subunit n=2 Tax=Morganellaceae TaxID=1903414 RepID=UPI000649BDA2|nr:MULTISPECIES: efflux RND transporter periplasmic adaptor subunit [Xenorhabdus]KLU16682.1 RND transporter MFP subunit [Xenorhabdus griffiniae]KOP33565.1 RND transporter MFP subunit [Xenorhabdus sp. GDc328]
MMNKTIVVGLGIVLLALIGFFVYVQQGSDRNNSGNIDYPPVKVALAEVKKTTLVKALYGVGELEAERQVHLAAETSGRVVKIEFESGQYVEKGQLLVQINDAVEKADLARLKAQWRNAERLYQRTNKLFTSKVVSTSELDKALAERDMASAAIRQTEALIAQKNIRAPFSGVMGIRQIHEGQYLNAGDAIATLVDANNLKLNFSLNEQTSPELHVGQSVNLQVDAYPNQNFPATVNAIDPLIGNSRTVQVQARLNNAGGKLKAGMYANIQVMRQNNQPALVIPETAVTYTAYGDTVFVTQLTEQEENQAGKPVTSQGMTVKRVSVDVGQRWDGLVEIKKGLSQGEQVVTSGQMKLTDGTAVVAIAVDTLKAAESAATDS